MNTDNWKPGFEKRIDIIESTEEVFIDRYSAEQVDEVRATIGHEPKGYELSAYFTKFEMKDWM